MGPRDPFASRPAPPRPPAAPSDGAAAEGPVRIQAQTPALPARPGSPAARSNAVATGAAVGLGVGLLFVLLTPGQAILVLVLTALGAALGAIARSAFRDGVDLDAAWRALRRR